MALFGSLYCTMSVANHYYFRSTAFDYGPYNYAFWEYSHFHLTACPMYKVFAPQDINFLQDHFSLTLMYLVPFYWLLNWLTGTYTLLILQTAFILWGAWAIYKLINLKTGDGWLGIGAVLYYFLLQGRYSAFDEDCNIIIMCSCFVPVFLWYFESKRFIAAAVIFVLAVFSREDMSLWFPFIFVVLIIWHWKEKKLVYTCLAYIVASVICFVLIFKVFIPLIQTKDRAYDLFNYSALGDDPYHALIFIIKHPFDTFGLLFKNHSGDWQNDWVKAEFYFVYLLSGGFVLLYRPKYLIWFIPLIAQKMLNDDPIRWSIESYYAVQIVTLLPIPVFLILADLKSKKWSYSLSAIVCILALMITYYETDKTNRRLGAYSNPVKRNIFAKDFFAPAYDAKAIHKYLAMIPADASVSASASILPHLSQRKHIYEFPNVQDAQYVAVFTFHDFYGVSGEVYENALFGGNVFNQEWEIIANQSPFMLLKKVNGPAKVFKYDSVTCNAEMESPDKKHLIASDKELLDIDGETLDSERVHSGKYSIKLTRDKAFGMTFRPNYVDAGDVLCVSIWRYSEKKDTGMLILSRGSDFYVPSAKGVNRNSAGWEQIVIYCAVPENHKDFGIYVWDNGDGPVWFDDLEIKRFKK